ncbi:MAG: tryptophan--tRNA ligase [Patescibacteria group bacterium]
MSKNILTGLQSNSNLHIGNYLGAIKPIIKIQQSLESGDKLYMFVPDLHSFTLPTEHSTLFANTMSNLKLYIAAGLDVQSSQVFMFRQSFIPAHSELAWILSCFSYIGEMERMTQFKAKSQSHEQSITLGLFSYPALMAADILLYNCDYIPVGSDQQQHLELTRNLAIRLNNKFTSLYPEGLFRVPKVWKEQLEFMSLREAVKVRSLSNPLKKMSKSDHDIKGTIYLNDDPEIASKKIMQAQTDNLASIDWDWQNQPGITNLLQLLILLTDSDKSSVIEYWRGKTRYGELKHEVSEAAAKFLTRFQQNLSNVSNEQLINTLNIGEAQARKVANQTLLKVQKALGLREF